MKRVNERNALVKLLDKLDEDIALAPIIWQSVENGLITIPDAAEEGKKRMNFEAKVKKVGQLPVDYMATFLYEHGGSGLTKQMLDKIDGHDDTNILHIFCMATRTAPNTSLTAPMTHKQTATRVFKDRVAAVGKRLQGFSTFVRADGSVDWQRGGVFRLKFHENHLKSIKHVDGHIVDPLPEHVVVARAFILQEPWLDMTAKLSLGSSVHTLWQLFPDNFDPRKEKVGKGSSVSDELTKKVVADMEGEAAVAARGAMEDDAHWLKSHDEQMAKSRAGALELARQRLADGARQRRSLRIQATEE